MSLPRWCALIAASMLASWTVANANVCQNINGNCDTACPGAYSCFVDEDCGPGGSCLVDESICAPGACTCQFLLPPDHWWWSCQTICAGICVDGAPDSDQDGMPDHRDNCPWIPNPGQRDCDADNIGDVCDTCSCNPTPAEDPDGDSLCSIDDNCPFVANPTQANVDGDADGDACDCAPGDPSLYRPREIADVRVDRLPNGSRFHWSSTPPAERYEIQGAWLGAESPGQCWTGSDPDPYDTEYVEFEDPLPHEGWWYLFRGVSNVCGEAPWGPAGLSPSCP